MDGKYRLKHMDGKYRLKHRGLLQVLSETTRNC